MCITNENIKDVATLIRQGMNRSAALSEIAEEWELPLVALTARFDRAFPEEVPSIPSKEEMEHRHQVQQAVERQRAIDERNAIISFFNRNPEALDRAHAKMREQGRRSATYKEAKILAL